MASNICKLDVINIGKNLFFCFISDFLFNKYSCNVSVIFLYFNDTKFDSFSVFISFISSSSHAVIFIVPIDNGDISISG